jgi:3-phosphoshikimate 1-carboxyvinyltransferase
VENPDGRPRGDIEVDASNFPNIIPTLAAIGAYIDGSMRIFGGRLTRFHKTSRIEAIVTELSRSGVDIESVYEDGVCDGFVVRGRPTYPGGQLFSSWGDHRIFMSLFVGGLRMKSGNMFSGFEDVRLSFPQFLSQFTESGTEVDFIDRPEKTAEDDDN